MAFSSSGDDIAAKLKTKQNLKSAKDASRRLEEENKRMEERLFEFKKVMGNQRDDTQDTSLGFWKTGQTGQLSSYGKDLIEKKIKEGKQKKKAPKVKILKEEQLKLEQKPSKVSALKNLSSPKPGGKENKVKGVRCGQCEERAAHVSCLECGEDYCASCFAGFHLKGALKKHRSAPLGANNVIRTPRSTGSVTFKPDISEIQSLPYTPKSPEESDMDHGETNGALMDGNYDEAANAREFQEALKAWRGEKTNTTSKEVSKPRSQVRVPVYSDTHKESAESGTSTEVVKGTVEIKFKQSLTYAERLLLKTHRREAGKSPSDSNQISSPEEITTWDSPVTRIGLDISDSEREKSIMRETSLHLSESRPTSQMSIIDISDDKPNRDRSKPTRHRSRYQVNESVDFNGSDFTERKEAFLSSRLENYDKKPEREKTITRAPPTKTVQENHDTKRPKSRLMSARGSRPMSARNTRPKSRAQRAKSALGGQLSARENYSEGGVLVKTPSEELKNISRRSETPVTYQTSYNSGSLGDFFLPQTETGNVTPRDQQNTRPASAAGQWKVSHKIYQTAPRSWKQDSSVIPAVDDEQLQRQVEETTLAYQTFMDGMDEDVHDSDDLNLYMTAKPEEKRPNSSRNSAKRREDIYADNEQLDDLALGRVTPNMMITPRKVYKTDPLDRPSSVASYSARAIVVDGDDMSQYDGNEPNYQAELNQEDSNALNILAAELAKDTKLDLFDKKDGDVRKKSGANMAQGRDLTKDDLLHGTDIMKMMRPSDLYDNPDELECLAGEEEVKALR